MWQAVLNTVRTWRRDERGSQGTQAAAAALAAMVIVVGLGFGARTAVVPAVDHAFHCAAAVLQGGGATCAPAAQQAATSGAAAQQGTQAQDHGLSHDFVNGMAKFFKDLQNGNIGWVLKQLWGVVKGFGLSAWDMLTGFKDLAKDLWGLASGDAATRAKYANLIEAFRRDPVAMLKALGQGVLAPIEEAWARGDYGEAAGRVLFEIVSAVVGDKGVGEVAKAGKVEEILQWARGVDRAEEGAADAARGVARAEDATGQAGRHLELPCVGLVAPRGKLPGLGAPLLEGCTRGARAAQAAQKAEQESIAAARRLGGDINYGQLDALGRPSGIEARITKDMIDGKIGSVANSDILLPGFESGKGYARGHLLGKQLGGSGYVDSNLVTLYQTPANSPVMRGFENQVRQAVEAGEVVEYTATPIYQGNNPIPVAVTLSARGDRGFNLFVSILNKP